MFSQWSRHLVSHSQAAALCSPPCATRNRAARVYVFAVQSMSSTTGAGAGGGANSGARRVVVWYRGTDLRLHDQPAVHEAASRVASGKATEVLPVFCFDPRFFSASVWGTPKTGAYRAQFLLESVADLKASLRRRGSDLLVCVGRPEEVLPALAAPEAGAGGGAGWAVLAGSEVTTEEVAVERKVGGCWEVQHLPLLPDSPCPRTPACMPACQPGACLRGRACDAPNRCDV